MRRLMEQQASSVSRQLVIYLLRRWPMPLLQQSEARHGRLCWLSLVQHEVTQDPRQRARACVANFLGFVRRNLRLGL